MSRALNAFSAGASPKSLRITQDPCPYTCTAGHWLHRDKLQREARYVQFDFAHLCEVAIGLCEGASCVSSYEKKEEGYNRVFILAMDTGKHVIARISTRVAGPPRLVTNSELATIEYLQSKIALPVPKILAWSDEPGNPVGSEYIIQDHVNGAQLHEHWSKMNTPQHMLSYGNIYFADAPIEDASFKIPLENDFCIGPYCNPLFWNCGAGGPEIYDRPSPNCGPWKTISGYASGLIDTAFSRLPNESISSRDCHPFQGSVEDHRRLLKICHETMQRTTGDDRVQKAALPTAIHADYNKRNIYVSPDDPTITGLTDWQQTAIEPAFLYAPNTPDFAALPEADPSEEDHTSKSRDEEQSLKDLSICQQTYKCRKLRPGRQLDSSLFRLFHYCFTSWRGGVPAIRQELIDLRALWQELKLPGSECPYSPSEQELADHARQFEDFETTQKLKTWLKISMQTTSDGWVPNEVWKVAQEAKRAAYDEWIETARSEMSVEKADILWPFDRR
ncbi:hypothetical protein BDW62DRAFT_220049 [Aspergillus aurantiobrunneus]